MNVAALQSSRERISNEDDELSRGLRHWQSQKREDCEGKAAFKSGHERSLKFQYCAMGVHAAAQG
ncbi:hypothetical protein N7453_002554 [Penicillium expansum]|nr:hypothetical protein N7453_002554 [Penicillium expansum]